MGLPALALSHTLNTNLGLYVQPQEPVLQEEKPSGIQPLNPEIYEPFGGWQIFQKPEPLGNGIYSIKFSAGHKDLSVFNNDDKLSRLKYELNSFSSPNLKHLIIDFNHCTNDNYDVHSTGDVADFLIEKREAFIKRDRTLSLAHLEGHLYHEATLKFIDSFIHETIEDAIKNENNKKTQQQPVHINEADTTKTSSIPSYIRPRLFVDDIKGPAHIAEVPGNYLG